MAPELFFWSMCSASTKRISVPYFLSWRSSLRDAGRKSSLQKTMVLWTDSSFLVLESWPERNVGRWCQPSHHASSGQKYQENCSDHKSFTWRIWSSLTEYHSVRTSVASTLTALSIAVHRKIGEIQNWDCISKVKATNSNWQKHKDNLLASSVGGSNNLSTWIEDWLMTSFIFQF